jgi:hypothetical protein
METHLFESYLFSQDFSTIVDFFQFCRRDTADGSKESAVVEPVHPFQGGVFHVFKGLPGTMLPYELVL